jgi:hypothetical protein
VPCRRGRHFAVAVFDDGRDVQFDGGDATPGAESRQLAAGLADVRPHHDEAVPVRRGSSRGPDVRAAERGPRAHAGQRAHERGAGAEEKRRARALGCQHPRGDRLQVRVFGGIDHDPAAVPPSGQQLADSLRAAEPDVVEADAADVVPGDRAAALFRHEVTQVRCAVAERGVLGELRLAHRHETAAHSGPVDVSGGQPPRLQERRHEQHAVIAAVGRLPAHRVQGLDLRHQVPAEGRIAPANKLQACAAPFGHGQQAPRGQHIGLDGGGFLHAAGVGEDEAGRGRAGQRGAVRLLLKDGHHLDAVHRLRPRGVVVEHAEEQAVRGPHRADGGAQALVVRPGSGKPA